MADSNNKAFFDAFMAENPRSFFHIDWSGVLQPKSFVRRQKLNCKKNPSIDPFAANLELDALSFFGVKHLWGDRTEWATACRELMCEWIRREQHEKEISRLHCLFGCDSIEEIHAFAEREKLQAVNVWRVLAVDFSEKKDMKWFERDGTLMEKLYFVDCYWRGMPADDAPVWEYLLHPTIYVEEQVQ